MTTSDAPEPVTKTRRWQVVATFDVTNTPDPAYDVMACERLADELTDAIRPLLAGLPRVFNLEVDDVSTYDA